MSGHGLAITIAVVLVAITIALAVYASRQLSGTSDHYVAGGRLRGWQNGLALAGDQISAGSFLGITGAVALTGFTGFYLAAGLPAAYLLILLLVAEPLRNLGRFTLADVIAARFEGRLLRAGVAVATLIISIVYMVIQFVGAGLVAQLLFGIDYWIVVVFLGVISLLYTLLGGMIAATYIQMFKASVLLVIVAALVLVTISRTGWNPVGPLLHARRELGAKVITPLHKGTAVSLENVSLSLGLVLGFMGLPHVVLRFMTVRDGRAARDSTRIAMWIFCVFFLVLVILGYAALNEVGKASIAHANKAGNLAAPQLAQAVGGQLLFALVSGVVIATVLAVLASLAITSSGAVAHDLYTQVIKRGDVSPHRQLQISRVSGGVIALDRRPHRAGREGQERRLPQQRRLCDCCQLDHTRPSAHPLLAGVQPRRRQRRDARRPRGQLRTGDRRARRARLLSPVRPVHSGDRVRAGLARVRRPRHLARTQAA